MLKLYFGTLLNVGLLIQRDSKSRPVLHAKFSIYDAERMLLGSANWSNGASENVEIIASSSDYDEVSQVIGIFNQLWTLGTPYVPKQNVTDIL